MLSHDVGCEIAGLCELQPASRLASAGGSVRRAATDFAALSDTSLGSRFVSWPGLSGKTYVFSVFTPSACPAFCDAVLLAVRRDDGGARCIVGALDTGAFPEPVLARAERELGPRVDAFEFHVHLLARSAAERRAALVDLEAGREPIRNFDVG